MVFSERLRGGGFPVALEITPPQRPLHAVLVRRAGFLSGRAAAINVIQRPGRQPSLDASLELKAEGLEPAWHMVTRGRSAGAIAAELERAAAADIGLVLAILGDHEAAPDAVPGPTIREAIAMARSALPAAAIGATFNQHGRDLDAAFRNLLPKLAAGAEYVQTQPVFDIGAFETAASRIRREAPQARIIPMVMPLPTAEAAGRIAQRLGFDIPQRVRAATDPWAAFEEIVRALRTGGLADGLAVMTFEMDPPPESALNIVSALERAGALS